MHKVTICLLTGLVHSRFLAGLNFIMCWLEQHRAGKLCSFGTESSRQGRGHRKARTEGVGASAPAVLAHTPTVTLF